jgi:hypothetical protein
VKQRLVERAVGAGEVGAGAVELVGAVRGTGGEEGGVVVAFGAEVAVEDPGVVGRGEGLGFGPGESCGDGVGGAALVGEQVRSPVGLSLCERER